MKHAYIPRTTTYNLNPGEELNDLRMSDEVRPLYEHVKKFIRETVDPMSVEFVRLGEKKTDRWSFTPDQLAVLQKAKDKAKEVGLWNFFLPDDETGQGLKNLDYAYIAVELGEESAGLGDHELLGAGHRQHGGAGARRHQGAEGEVAEAAARRRDPFRLRDDRTERRLVGRQEHFDHRQSSSATNG